MALAGGGASARPAPGPFQLAAAAAAARARKPKGETEAAAAVAPQGGRVCGASSTRGPLGPRRSSHAAPAPGPAGRLCAGLGGSAAGLPDHPGEPPSAHPLGPSRDVSLVRAQGYGSPRSGWGPSGSGVGVLGPGVQAADLSVRPLRPRWDPRCAGDLNHSASEAGIPRAPSLSAPQTWPGAHPRPLSGPLSGEPLPGPRALVNQSLRNYASPLSGRAWLSAGKRDSAKSVGPMGSQAFP